MHIDLIVLDGSGTEPVHVEPLGERRWRLLHSPGFVDGVAAGDEIELLDSAGSFRILRRGGNVAIHLFSESPIAPVRAQLDREVRARLSGRVDGGIERGLVFTVPVSTGLPVIAGFFDDFVRSHPGMTWSYNNIYDPESGKLLEWWLSDA
jgi:hypothetical protein